MAQQKNSCFVCGAEKKIKNTKDGFICIDCFGKLPKGVRDKIDKFKSNDLKELIKILNTDYGVEHEFYNNELIIRNSYMIIDGFEYLYSNIKSMSFKTRMIDSNENASSVKCNINVILELQNPKVIIEENICTQYIKFEIIRDRIEFDKPKLERSLEANGFMDFINDSAYNTWNEFYYRKDKSNNSKYNSYGYYNSDSKSSNESSTNSKQESGPEAISKAEKLYRLNAPYNKADVKKARNNLLKYFHSDAGGDDEITKRIYDAYDVLINNVKG